jgi:hypothetical protein
MRRIVLVVAAAVAVAIVTGWLATIGLQRWFGSAQQAVTAAPAPAAAQEPTRKIRATLFYVTEDGTHLIGVPREVPFGETTADQARRLVEQQLEPAPAPYAQAIPRGTTVRAVFLTDRNEAFVDLSPEVSTSHPGGSLDELFSVYTIVNALTVNLPAIERVQILVDGKEVDSLAGHVDLRRPLPRNLTFVTGSGAAAPAPAPSSPAPPAETPPAAGAATPGTSQAGAL